MKIAFATQDKERVDAHFGWAKSIVVYDVSPQGHHFVESFEFGDKLEEDGDEDKLAPKLEAIKVPQPESIAEILDKLQLVLQGTPPPWLRKALAKDGERSFDFEEDEVTP